MREKGRDLREVARERDLLLVGTNPDPDRERKMADEELIVKFFAGDGSARYRHPAPDSPEELRARAVLARTVREYVPGFSGELLALALDPDTKSRMIGMKPTRKIKFESVKRGLPSMWRRNVLIAGFIRSDFAQHGKLEAAISAATAKFKISRTTAQNIWQERCDAMKDAATRRLWEARN